MKLFTRKIQTKIKPQHSVQGKLFTRRAKTRVEQKTFGRGLNQADI